MTTSQMTRVLLACVFSIGLSTNARASLVDLNDFFADPTVTVSADGLTATLEEEMGPGGLDLVILSNDPGLGDPPVLTGGPSQILRFDFEFFEPAGEVNEFGAFVIDLNTGFSAGPDFEFFTRDSSSGTISFDLSSLPGTVGLQFELSTLLGDSGSGSVVTISNVVQLQQLPTIVPEPATLLLFCGGIGTGLLARRRPSSRKGESRRQTR